MLRLRTNGGVQGGGAPLTGGLGGGAPQQAPVLYHQMFATTKTQLNQLGR